MIDEKRLIRECEERLLVGTNVIKMIEERPKICEWIPIAEKLPEPGEYTFHDSGAIHKIIGHSEIRRMRILLPVICSL